MIFERRGGEGRQAKREREKGGLQTNPKYIGQTKKGRKVVLALFFNDSNCL